MTVVGSIFSSQDQRLNALETIYQICKRFRGSDVWLFLVGRSKNIHSHVLNKHWTGDELHCNMKGLDLM